MTSPHPARRWLWPAWILLGAAALAALFLAGAPAAAVAALPVAILGALALWERALAWDPDQAFWRDPELLRDLGHAGVGSGGGELLGGLVLAWAIAAHGGALPAELRPWPAAWPAAAQVALFIAVADVLDYARHRFMHHSPRGWRLHGLHHAVDRMHVFKGGRVHVADFLTRTIFILAPLALLGAPVWLLPSYGVALLLVGPISHANLDVALPAWVHRCVVTPPVHRIHHARARELSGRNLANLFPLWDLLFGTFEPPALAPQPIPVGVEGERWPDTFGGQLLSPFTRRFAPVTTTEAPRDSPGAPPVAVRE